MCKENKHLVTSVILGAFFGATITFLVIHEPTKKKIIKHARIAHKKTLKKIKEKIDRIKVE